MRLTKAASVLGCTLAAAGTVGAVAATSGSAASNTPLTSVFFANPLPAYPAWGIANGCFYAEAKKFHLRAVSQGPTGLNINDQYVVARIQQAMAQKYGALITVPITPSEYQPIIQRARKQGMLVATLNTGNSTSAQNFDIGTSYSQEGASLAKIIGQRGGQQNLGLVTNGPGGIGATIFRGLEKNLPSNVHLVATAYDDANPSNTESAVANMLIAHPTINVIYSWEGTAVAGITAAIKEQNMVGKTVAITNDLTPQVVAGIKAGTIYGTNEQHFCAMAKEAVADFVAISKGKKVPKMTDSGTTFVTKKNLAKALATAKSTD